VNVNEPDEPRFGFFDAIAFVSAIGMTVLCGFVFYALFTYE